MKSNKNFSVLMSVYFKEQAKFLDLALKSVLIEQTIKPSEIVLIKDGPLGEELNNIVNKYKTTFPKIFKIIEFQENKGLGNALKIGVEQCSNDIIMRMDTDDICVKDRFAKQIRFMEKNPDVSVVGGYIKEFENDIFEETTRLKKMPLTYEEIKKYAKMRNPLNHMTVCFRKKDVLEVGNYQHMLLLEDYYLWARMLINNKKIANIDSVLVYARIGNGFIERRKSKKCIIGWKNLQKFLYKNKFINLFEKFRNIISMYIIVYTPKKFLSFLYKNFFRKK